MANLKANSSNSDSDTSLKDRTLQPSLTASIFVDTYDVSTEESDSSSGDDDAEAERSPVTNPSGKSYDRSGTCIRSLTRIYYLDWIRIIAIYLVVAFHVVQALDWVGMWKGAEEEHAIIYMVFSLQIGMPLFFHISGRAQALAKPQSYLTVLWQRFIRLLVPYIVCQIVLVPPWLYIHLRIEHDHKGQWKNVFDFLWWYWHPQNYIYDPAWLWFLLVLFMISVFNAPLFLYAEKRYRPHAVLYIVQWLVVCPLLCFLVKFSVVFALCAAAGGLSALLLAYLVPLPAMGGGTDDPHDVVIKQWMCCRAVTAVHIIAMVLMVCNFQYTDFGTEETRILPNGTSVQVAVPEYNMPSLVPMLLCFNGFYTQGYFVMRWHPKRERLLMPDMKEHLRITQIYQVPAVFFIFVALAWGSPAGDYELRLYPVYSASYKHQAGFAAAHVMGTWAFIAASLWSCQAYLEYEIDPWWYEHCSKSTIVVYIFHWVFLKPFVWWVIKDYNLMHEHWQWLSVGVSFVVSVGGALVMYAFFLRVPMLGRLFGL